MIEPQVDADAFNAFEAAGWERQVAGYEDPPFFRYADDTECTGLLRGRGFEDVGVETISFSHREPSAEALWRGLMGGAVRTSAMIARQAPEVQRRIRGAFDRIVEEYHGDAGLELPVSVKLASGRKPT